MKPRWLFPLVFVVATATKVFGVVEDPVDVTVYADHIPEETQDGSPFLNPFVNPSDFADDLKTRVLVKEVPGLRYPPGSHSWGVAAWGKYVLLGNYDEQNGGLFQTIDDQEIGVYNTETGVFCTLDLDPDHSSNAGIEWIRVANPQARTTRIFFSAFADTGADAGYIDGDMDNETPCDAMTGWHVTPFTRAGFNQATPPGVPLPCPESHGCFDGMEFLGHDSNPAHNFRDTLVFNNWLDHRIIIAQIDADGTLHVPDVHVMPYFKPAQNGDICFINDPVALPAADRTRSAGDYRFTATFDMFCGYLDGVDTTGCAPPVGICPNGSACTADSPCPGGAHYCNSPVCVFLGTCSYRTCTPGGPPAQCQYYDQDLGPCTNCPQVHPGLVCANDITKHCGIDAQCNGSSCSCKYGGRGAQEFSFDETRIKPKSPQFQSAVGHLTGSPPAYDSFGNLWVGDHTTPKRALIYLKNANGEHSYYSTAYDTPYPNGEIRPEDTSVQFEENGPYALGHMEQVGTTMYLLTRNTIQRSVFGYGSWLSDTTFKWMLGHSVLPPEDKRCEGGVKAGQLCTVAGDCPSSTCVDDNDPWNVADLGQANVSAGGAPPSLWTTPRFADDAGYVVGGHGSMDAYLARVPIATAVPDGVLSGRPTVAWSGGTCTTHPRRCRLWLAAMKAGSLQYRVRDDGFWSLWAAVPSTGLPGGVNVAGGPALVQIGTGMQLYARGSDGIVYRTTLVSPITCTPEAGPDVCTWGAWQALPSNVHTDSDVAAVSANGIATVVVRDANGYLWAIVNVFGWSPWAQLGTKKTSSAPAVTYHAADNHVWAVMRHHLNGDIFYARLAGTAVEGGEWQRVLGNGNQAPWGAAPGIASDGTMVHVYAAATGFPQWIYQNQATSQNNAATWANWRLIPSNSIATFQPAATSVNGVVNLVSTWYTAGMSEQALE